MNNQLPDHFDAWADWIGDVVMDALREWSTGHLAPTVFPALVADADDDAMTMDLAAILAATAAWETIAERRVGPVLAGITAARAWEMLTARGIDPGSLTPAPSGLAAEVLDEAVDNTLAALARAGITASPGEVVVLLQTATWADFLPDWAAATMDKVKYMPESVYREMVTTLAAATRDGLKPTDRAAIVRAFLDMTDEKALASWRNRAMTIARTETNAAINAGGLQAGHIEANVTGQQMHKAWVCAIDHRTRDTHFAADGQRVPLDGKFLIGGYEADHPGDQNLPAHESINCRCSMLILTADEPLPDDTDRQTERGRTVDSRPVPARDPAAEVARRKADGVTRDRDDAGQPIAASATTEGTPMRTTWSGLLAPIDKPTGDGRIIDADATIGFREFPLPLLFQRATSGGHDTAVVVGKITSATAEADAIHATGELFDTPDALEARDLLAEGVIRPSVDMCDMVVDYEVVDGDGKKVDPEVDDWDPAWSETMHVRSATIMAATLVSKPAFAEAKVTIGEEVPAPEDAEEEKAALLAAAALAEPAVDSAAFDDPGLSGPTALTVTDDGRVVGHLALWGTEHVGMPGRRVTPPRSSTGYAMFHVSTVVTDEGPVSCGRLTVGCGHAGPRDGAHAATEHYDNAGSCWALVRAGEDEFGIWVAGIINPDADEATVRAGASAPLSGDWRSVGGNLELVAALSVNTPGFPVPRVYSATQGAEMSLVAAAVVPRRTREDVLADAVAEGLRRHEARRDAEAAARQRTAEARRLAASVMAGGLRK